MPNWCNNSVTLTAASKEEADELFQHMKKEDDEGWTFFGFFVPEDWDENNWYWSRVEAWGTKWDASLVLRDIRQMRNRKLFVTDWTQVPDCTLSDTQKAEARTYRTALRDITSTLDNPSNTGDVVWPTPPSFLS